MALAPASPGELALWAGVNIGDIAPSLLRLEIRHFKSEGGQPLVDLPRAPLPDEVRAPVRFLPTWDATLLVHARRAEIVPERYRSRIFNTKMPQSVPTFMVDGSIAGLWREREGKVVLEPFHPLSPQVSRQVEREAVALQELFA